MIRWIVEGKLGTAPKNDVGDVSATILDVRDLVDKRGNAGSELRAKISEGVAALRREETLIVACDFGVSRSNAVAAGVLYSWRGGTLDDAFDEVIKKTGEKSIKLEMIASIRAAVEGGVSQAKADRRLLITGGSGYIGSRLYRLLSSQRDVLAPSRLDLDLLEDSSKLDRFCRINKIGIIFHSAFPRIYTNNNSAGQSITMLLNILDVCRLQGIKLVLPSGAGVFAGYRTEMLIAGVQTACFPKGVYGETQYLQETIVTNAVASNEIKATIVRISPTYGPGALRPRLIRFAYETMVASKEISIHRYLNGLSKIQLLYVDDAIDGLVKAIDFDESRILHLGGERSFNPRELISCIADISGREPIIREVAINDTIGNVYLDSVESAKYLDWAPKISLFEGLRSML